MNYEKQAQDFAKKFGLKMEDLGYTYRPYFVDDKESRCVFKLKLKRKRMVYSFTFGQSIAAGAKSPTLYDVLACLTKYDPESFEDFCSEYGYFKSERKSEMIYGRVLSEWQNVEYMFGDCLDELREIQ